MLQKFEELLNTRQKLIEVLNDAQHALKKAEFQVDEIEKALEAEKESLFDKQNGTKVVDGVRYVVFYPPHDMVIHPSWLKTRITRNGPVPMPLELQLSPEAITRVMADITAGDFGSLFKELPGLLDPREGWVDSQVGEGSCNS